MFAIPEPPDDPITQRGDIWVLGDHRLMCGDSSSPADLDRLLDGAAIETADIALMSDDLSKVSWLIRHSRRTLLVIRQNIAFALGLKALFITLALLGMATLWMAIAADMGASLLVIFNGLRLLDDGSDRS